MKKRVEAALLGAAMVVGTFSGTVNVFAEEEKPTITALVYFDEQSENVIKKEALQETADAMGYNLELECVDDATYKTKIRVMLQANELPDIFYSWGGSYTEPFLEADALYPLEDALAESGYELSEVYKQPAEDGHMYAIPTNALEAYCLFYNKDVFEQLGCDVPMTWDELLEVVEKCNEAGISALDIGNKDRWEGDLLYNMLVEREDSDAFAEAVADDGDFTGDAFVQAAEKLKTLIDMGAFHDGYNQASGDECLELLRIGQIAMYPAGSWNVAAFENDENIGISVFPGTGAEDPYLSCCGNAADAGMVVSKSDNSEVAAKFVVEYTKTINDNMIKNGFQSFYSSDLETGDTSEMRKAYIADFNKLEKTQLWWYTYLDTAIGEPMRDLSQQFFSGTMEVEDYIEKLNETIKG